MHIGNSSILYFSEEEIKNHAAFSSIQAYLKSIHQKNLQAFASCFGSCDFSGFFANLPGSVKVYDPKKFIDMHDAFFASKAAAFVYGPLKEGIGNSEFLTCTVFADVTLPDGSKRAVHIDMTFLRNEKGSPAWIPIRFINTVVDKSQAVLHN